MMEQVRPSISIVGGTLWGNRGAEAMLTTVIGRLKHIMPDASFEVFSYYPARDRALLRGEGVNILDGRPLSLVFLVFPLALCCRVLPLLGLKPPAWLLSREVKALRRSIFLADIGGITFSDGRELFLLYNVFSIWPAMLLGVPVIKLAQAVGPFERPLNRFVARVFLSRCMHIFARGKESIAALSRLIEPNKVELASDAAFLYEDGFSLTSENEQRTQETEAILSSFCAAGRKVVAIAPSALVLRKALEYGRDYFGTLRRIAEVVIEGGDAVLVFPNACREGERGFRNNDLEVIALFSHWQDILETEQRRHLVLVDFDINTASSRRLLGLADVLIASRFHAMISGFSLGIPTMVIGWGHKYRELMDDLGMGEFFLDFKEATETISLFQELLRRRDSLRRMIQERLPAVRDLAQGQFRYLETLF